MAAKGGGFVRRCVAVLAAAVLGVAALPGAAKARDLGDGGVPPYPCAQAAPPQTQLDLNSSVLAVQSRPWGLVYLNENIAFAAINFSVGVLDTTDLAPVLKYLLPLPPAYMQMGNTNSSGAGDGYGLREMTLTTDKGNLYVATGYGAAIVDVPRALLGRNDSYVGFLSHQNGYAGDSAIQVTITADDKFAFISQEFGSNATHELGAVEVYNITRQANRTVTSDWRGFIALGFRTIGMEFSADHQRLFVTSEINGTARSLNQTGGVISVLDVATLRVHPGQSLIKSVPGGCHPVRSTMSADQKQLWVTTRESNQVLAFDAIALADNSTNATTASPLLASLDTGTSPLGITAIKDYIFTADSNRWNYTGTTTGVSVINIVGALQKGFAKFPQIPTGAFPRTVVTSPSGNRMLISEFGAASIRAVDISLFN